ncbi:MULTISPECIES: SNF2-related protein [Deinococcus]|uniref:SNF2-related protein n=1 Tax=Deinococcus rufus TaxID=2136097 RepID=A0ABV7ZC37_9DEIO|nr:SNF2-related protein [Deinococcus sp. AB2017081]WQE94282.1 SNF2-related protein [Deinococcus sp. AB2017081]
MKLSRLPPGFGLDTAAQGLALREGAVQGITREWTDSGWRVAGTVHDGGTEYDASAELLPPPDPQLRSSSCTCGRYRCRHVAALVLATDPPSTPRPAAPAVSSAATGSLPPVDDVLDARTQQWLASFQEQPGQSRGRQFELRYVLRLLAASSGSGARRVALQIMRLPVRGDVPDLRAAERYAIPKTLSTAPGFVRRDARILRLLEMATAPAHEPGRYGEELYALTDHPAGDLLIDSLLDSGRLCWERVERPLHRGPELAGELAWASDARGAQTPTLKAPQAPDALILPVTPAWAVLTDSAQLSRLSVNASADQVSRFLAGPTLAPAQATALAHAITAAGLHLPIPQTVQIREEDLPYTPQLHLSGRTATVYVRDGWARRPETRVFPAAELRHAYGGLAVPDGAHTSGPTLYRGGVLTRVTRRPDRERDAERDLHLAGFQRLQELHDGDFTLPGDLGDLLGLDSDEAWTDFMRQGRAELEAQGFTVLLHADFPLNYAQISDWYGHADDSAGGWFTLDLGIVVDGQQVSLIPVLADLIARQPELFTPEALAELQDDETITALLADGRRVALPAGRIRAILSVLVELNLRDLPPGPLKLPLLDAARLAELESAVQARWLGAERLLDLGRRLRDFGGIDPVAPPPGLHADLRPYQQQGLAWLQFLRQYDMGGILADDMGLGKAQPLDARVLTPSGWRRMGDLRVGDDVIGRDGRPTAITGVYPQGGRPIYRVTLTDGASVLVDEDHLWAVQTPVRRKRGQPWRVLSTAEIAADLRDAAGNLKHYLPMVEAPVFDPQQLPVDPYTLGALLGDGHLSHGIGMTTEDVLVASLDLPAGVFAQHAARLTETVSTYRLVSAGQWTPNALKDALRALGLHGLNGHSKFIPPAYLLGTPAQRLAVLQGLLDTDGHAGVVVEYTSVSEALARGVVELVQSLGGTARICRKLTTHVYFGERRFGTAWRVTLKLPAHLDPFRLPQKLAAYRRPTKYPPSRGVRLVEYVGVQDAQCISVAAPDRLYVTEAYIVTHNTVQTLAHLLLEQDSGRADRPSLVVAPTSVIGNWQAEAAKFAPSLRVLTLHGKDRRASFPRIPAHDLILTTYPLLPRDLEELSAFQYHLVILDEAQNIKNSKTAAAKAAGSLDARYRLALTGTPLENHLGELWSQFNFLAPGLLHDERTFRELYRTPIEKRGDPVRRSALAARVRPFILRREKRDVARELPPKTEIPVRVTLDGDQRDLYETVRVTMQGRVQEELRARGLSRSTIAILDALLKLRQAVTDPRLVKLEAAAGVQNNAKFDWLQGNLPQMLEEGRRVLIFSSFATLLGHLEPWLKSEGIPYSMLTGQTQDRQTQIDAFQAGTTHVFLITLKAGGVGLNLTAADTVIHYDPWWNPAAEDQATDRAYRIGQDKPVFVYKLIAAGSVEERILDLQSRKASLARGILDGGLSDATQLTAADLDRLFAPLEDGEEPEARPGSVGETVGP